MGQAPADQNHRTGRLARRPVPSSLRTHNLQRSGTSGEQGCIGKRDVVLDYSCGDLFPGNDQRERILVFPAGVIRTVHLLILRIFTEYWCKNHRIDSIRSLYSFSESEYSFRNDFRLQKIPTEL